MTREQIEKAARVYVMPNENTRPLMESIVAKEGFIAGADWVLGHLCSIPLDEALRQLAEYAEEKDSGSKEETK